MEGTYGTAITHRKEDEEDIRAALTAAEQAAKSTGSEQAVWEAKRLREADKFGGCYYRDKDRHPRLGARQPIVEQPETSLSQPRTEFLV